MEEAPMLPELHTQSSEAEQAQAEYEAAVARKRGWAEDPIVKRICEINNCRPADVTPEMRRAGKVYLFGELYWLRPGEKLARTEMAPQSCAPQGRVLVVGGAVGLRPWQKAGIAELLKRDFATAEACIAAGLSSVEEQRALHGVFEVGTLSHVAFENLARQGEHAMRSMQKMRAEAVLEGYREMAGSTPFDVMLALEMSEDLRAIGCPLQPRVDGKPPQFQPSEHRDRAPSVAPPAKTIAKNRAKAKAARAARKRSR